MSTIAIRLRKLRNKSHFSQKDVAEKLGLSPSTYRDWEYGRKIVGEPYVKLAEIFSVSLTELMTGQPRLGSELIDRVDELDRQVKIIRKIVESL